MRDDKVLGSTIRIDCTTHDATGALVAPSSAFAASDFRVYKDGSATEKTTTNGITVTSPFDSIVGKHLIEIDTSNSTGDVGFWAAGSEYRVELHSAKTVSGIAQSGVVVGRFALVAAGVLRPLVDGRTIAVAATTGAVELDSSVLADIADIKADSAASAGYGADLVAKITANAASAIQNLWHLITGSGSGSKFTTAALENAPTGGDDWTAGEKEQIRYRLGLDGIATAPEEPAVDPIVITPATGIMTTGYLVTRVKGVATAGIKIYYQHVQEPTADRGSSYDDTIYSAISNSEGIAELALVKGGLYYIWRSSTTRPKDLAAYRVVKADGTTPDSTLALPSHIGH